MLIHTASGRQLLMAWARRIMSFGFINKVTVHCLVREGLCTFLDVLDLFCLCCSTYYSFSLAFDSLRSWSFHCFSLHSLLPLLPAKMGHILSNDNPYTIRFKTIGFVAIFPRFYLSKKRPSWLFWPTLQGAFIFLKILRKDDQVHMKSHVWFYVLDDHGNYNTHLLQDLF